MTSFAKIIRDKNLILTDGGIETRILYEFKLNLPEEVEVAGLIYDSKGKEVLTKIYNSYLDVAQAHNLPIILGTPTFRANPHRVANAGLNLNDIITRCSNFLHELRQKRGNYRKNIFIAGVIGPKNDAFNPNEALPVSAAKGYHATQIAAFKQTKVDFLFAPTFPALSEALGVCSAMSESGFDYVISFVLNKEGLILDGHTLDEAIKTIDKQVHPKPLFYSLSCIHPTVAIKALQNLTTKGRLLELKANASRKSTQELIALKHLDTGDPAEFGKEMQEISQNFNLKILGGCCGTNQHHIEVIAKNIL